MPTRRGCIVTTQLNGDDGVASKTKVDDDDDDDDCSDYPNPEPNIPGHWHHNPGEFIVDMALIAIVSGILGHT